MAQYEQNESITILASKIATVVNNNRIQSQENNKQSIKNKDTKEITNSSKNTETKNKEKENTSTSELKSEEFQTTKSKLKETENHPTKNTSIRVGKNEHSVESQGKIGTESNLAEANSKLQAKNVDETVMSRESIIKDMDLTTEKAGLILVHPFLFRFFNGIELLTEDKQIDDIGKACMLLHYIATETEEVTDVELTLEKILLGIPLETVVNYQTPLTEKDKNLCEELLLAVLEHWVVLKKSTINTLRDMFLKREGELTMTDKNIKLKVERAAQDILLEKVPWNISLLRSKWMDTMMHVEW